jgi:hypothetical protein
LLVFLAERMTKLNLEKQTTAGEFATSLIDLYGFDVHTLKPKSRIHEFWKLEKTEVLACARANKLRLDDFEKEQLLKRFQKAKNRLVPLESQITFTDALIDQIVYRLYGLTPEEIQLAEDSVKC